jgi:hypothetical protein
MEYPARGLGQFDHDLGSGYTPSLNLEGCLHVVERRAYDLRRGVPSGSSSAQALHTGDESAAS